MTSNPPSPRVRPSSVTGIRASSAGPMTPSRLASMARRLPLGVQTAGSPPMTRVIVSSTHRPLRLLLVEDADDYAALVSARLAAAHEPPEAVRFADLDDALRHLAHADVDCVLLGVEDGVERVLAAKPQVPIVVLADREDDVRLIRAGAQDIVVRGSEGDIMQVVRHAVERRRSGERLEVERMVREVAAEFRRTPERRPFPGPPRRCSPPAGAGPAPPRPRRERARRRRDPALLAHRRRTGRPARPVC